MKIISIYSNSYNSGKKTLAMSMAQQAAQQNMKVLFCELDYTIPSVANTYGITHSERNAENYFSQAFERKQYDLTNYVINNNQIESSKTLVGAHELISSNIDFLVFSKGYRQSYFPNVYDLDTTIIYTVIQHIIEAIKQMEYDVVILKLPIHPSDMFCLPFMLMSDFIINIAPFSIQQVENLKSIYSLLDKETQTKVLTVLNLVSRKIEQKEFELLLKPLNLVELIPYDDARQLKEFNAEIGSPAFDNVAIKLLKTCDLNVAESKRSRFFGGK